MKILIYLGSIFFFLITLVILFAAKDDALAYRIASKLLGYQPESGDGAFQIPLGWLLVLVTSVVLGFISGYIVNNYLDSQANISQNQK